MPAGSARAGRSSSRTPLIATLVALVPLAGGYVLFRYSRRAAEAPAPPPPVPQATAKPVAPPPVVPAPTTSGDATAVPGTSPTAGQQTPGAAPGPAATPNPQTGPATGLTPAAPPSPPTGNPSGTKPGADAELVLQVAATERAWVAVDADGKTVFQRVLNPDEVQTLKAHKAFDLTTGNAQAVILTLNGETLKPLGRRGEVKSLHLTHEDLKNSTP
jgi:hypothetical protein